MMISELDKGPRHVDAFIKNHSRMEALSLLAYSSIMGYFHAANPAYNDLLIKTVYSIQSEINDNIFESKSESLEKMVVILKFIEYKLPDLIKQDDMLNQAFMEIMKKCNMVASSQLVAIEERNKKALQNILVQPDNSHIFDLPNLEYWRMYIDGAKQRDKDEKGWEGYEQREPGCIQSMHSALLHAINTTGQVSQALITEINRIAMSHLDHPISLRSSSTSTGCDYFSQTGELPKYLRFYHDYIRKAFVSLNLEEAFNKNIDCYEQTITKSLDKLETLYAIVNLCKSIVSHHPYKDGNARTIVTILLNRELLRNGFPPVILDEPSVFEAAVSVHDLVSETLKGMKNFQHLCKEGKMSDCDDILQTKHLMESAQIALPQLEPISIHDLTGYENKITSQKHNRFR